MKANIVKFYKNGNEYEFKQYLSNIKVGTTVIEANDESSSFELASESGSVIAITADTTDNKVTIDIDKDLSKYDNSTSGFATLASPELSGTPTAPTASVGTNTTQIATTEFVTTAVTTVTNTVGAANGICPLNSSNKIDSSYLPSYVDDVVESYARFGQTPLSNTWLATESASGTVITPESGKIYVLMNSSGNYVANTLFRWGGSEYVKLNDGGVSIMTLTEINNGTDTTGKTLSPALLRSNFYTEGEVDTLLSSKANSATTLSGYGITDAKINNGTITLGSNTITPLTSHLDISGKANISDLADVATSGSYNDLSNTPTIPAAQIQSDWNQSDNTKKDFIKNKPSIPSLSGYATETWVGLQGYLTSFTETDPTVPSWAKASSKPTYTASEVGALPDDTVIPSALSDLSDDSTHRLVTDTEKLEWSGKSSFSGSYSDLTDKPSIPDDSNLVHKTGNETISGNKLLTGTTLLQGNLTGELYLNNDLYSESKIRLKDDNNEGWVQIVKGTGTSTTTLQQALDARNNVQPNWNETSTSSAAYILNKPTIPAALVLSDWNATTGMGVILNKPTIPTVPTNVSTFVNDAGYLTSHQDISGKADKSEMSVSTNGDSTTITLKSGTSATVINAHLSLSGKQDIIDSSHKLSADLISDGTTNKAYTATELTKLSGIAAGAEVNQNAFSNVKIGSSTIAADGKTDTIEFVAGSNNLISLTADTTNDKVTIEIDKDLSKYNNSTSGFITSASIPGATSTSPKMDGIAAVGSEATWAKGDHVHPSDTSKADKATTLAGYGITDANITSGVITLGSNSITPLTSHQDISGKADKATTLAGYGITDANIANGTITLGSNTITPLTSHQDISGKANASEMAVSTSGDLTTITLKNGTSATVINSHLDISGKANSSDLATVATTGNYTDLIGAPQYVICTLSAYNAMNTHDSNTYYIIIEDNNA